MHSIANKPVLLSVVMLSVIMMSVVMRVSWSRHLYLILLLFGKWSVANVLKLFTDVSYDFS
jgi:hypothetical protein